MTLVRFEEIQRMIGSRSEFDLEYEALEDRASFRKAAREVGLKVGELEEWLKYRNVCRMERAAIKVSTKIKKVFI
jgi:hypothetical protein